MKLSFQKVTTKFKTKIKERRQIQSHAAEILSSAKRAIFSVHRGDIKKAKLELGAATKAFKAGEKICKREKAAEFEGMWRAGLEEYCEAIFFYEYMSTGQIWNADLPTDEPDIVIGGLADFTGELVRQSVIKATEGDKKTVDHMYSATRNVVEALLNMDLTGNLRNKFDQAKRNLRRLEELRYDLSRRL
ncbi:MAG: hypothetical protein ABII13_02340 [Patescibacteria group bacterium]|nr:hypothetical protein [Patescibacteria group bacterium]MBU2508829.1 hypothetical protein [Patescibacteria group bacterium]